MANEPDADIPAPFGGQAFGDSPFGPRPSTLEALQIKRLKSSEDRTRRPRAVMRVG